CTARTPACCSVCAAHKAAATRGDDYRHPFSLAQTVKSPRFVYTDFMDISQLHFESVLPLIGAIFSFFFGFFIWMKNPRKDVNILFLGFCVAITYWLFGTFQMFINRDDLGAALFWDRFVYIGVVFVPSLMHHFSLA